MVPLDDVQIRSGVLQDRIADKDSTVGCLEIDNAGPHKSAIVVESRLCIDIIYTSDQSIIVNSAYRHNGVAKRIVDRIHPMGSSDLEYSKHNIMRQKAQNGP